MVDRLPVLLALALSVFALAIAICAYAERDQEPYPAYEREQPAWRGKAPEVRNVTWRV